MSTEELERAFKAHSRELRVFLYRQLQSSETAADMTQETWLRQRPSTPVANLRAFIFRIGRNLAIDHLRSRISRERHDEGLAYLYEVTGESPELIDSVAASQELEVLNAALQRMNEPEQSIFLKCRLQEISNRDDGYKIRQAGYAVSNLHAIYELDEHLELQYNLDNVFDRKYIQTVGNDNYWNFYGKRRNFNVALRAKF